MRLFVRLNVLVIATMLAPCLANAQTRLRWKLKPGEALTVEIENHSDSQVAFSGKSATTKIDHTVNLGWKVTAAHETGFTIRQSLERLRQKVVTAEAGTIEYDSAAAGRPTGQARELAESLKPLVGAEFDLEMSVRGIVHRVTPANEIAKALFAGLEQKGVLPDGRTQGFLEQMLRPSLAILPEKELAIGDSWDISNDRSTMTGQFALETTYRLLGIDDQDGKRLARISVTARAASKPGAKMDIKSHEQTGTILFSLDEGRITQIDQTQKLLTERPYRETTIVVTINSQEKTTIKPADASQGSGR